MYHIKGLSRGHIASMKATLKHHLPTFSVSTAGGQHGDLTFVLHCPAWATSGDMIGVRLDYQYEGPSNRFEYIAIRRGYSRNENLGVVSLAQAINMIKLEGGA